MRLAAVEEARQSIDEQVAAKLREGRYAIAAEEAKKAKAAAAADLQSKMKEVSDLQDLLAHQNKKLEEAQKEQAELLRKQRALDDARRELDLTIERRVQESLVKVRQKAKAEPKRDSSSRLQRKSNRSPRCSAKSRSSNIRPSRGRSNYRAKSSKSNLKQCYVRVFRTIASSPSARGSSAMMSFSGSLLR
jgi:hypothetical protein